MSLATEQAKIAKAIAAIDAMPTPKVRVHSLSKIFLALDGLDSALPRHEVRQLRKQWLELRDGFYDDVARIEDRVLNHDLAPAQAWAEVVRLLFKETIYSRKSYEAEIGVRRKTARPDAHQERQADG